MASRWVLVLITPMWLINRAVVLPVRALRFASLTAWREIRDGAHSACATWLYVWRNAGKTGAQIATEEQAEWVRTHWPPYMQPSALAELSAAAQRAEEGPHDGE